MNTSKKAELYRQAHRLVRKLKRKSIRKMSIFDSMGITPGEFRVMLVIDTKTGISLGAIANGWSMQNSNITAVVNKLAEKEYVIKRKDLADRRISRVYLTEEGKKVRSKITEEFDRMISINLAEISDEKIENALEAIVAILEQL